MKQEQLRSLSMVEMHKKIRSGEVTPIALLDAFMEKIESLDEKVTAWKVVDKDRAYEEARQRTAEAERGEIRGLFHGIPIGIKDIIDVEGLPTEHNCKAFIGSVAKEKDAHIVAKLRELGAVIVGKTHTAELAYFDPSPTKNPYNLAHTPGGSSSGSAAAVAAKMIPFSVGTQTNASVARPAAYNGVAGFKPTSGQFPLNGVLSFSPAVDSLGFFGKTFADAAMGYTAMQEMNACPFKDEKTLLTIGVVNDPIYEKATEDVNQAMTKAIKILRDAGHKVEEVTLPYSFARMVEAHSTIMTYEAVAQFTELVEKEEQNLGDKFCELIKRGRKMPKSEYDEAYQFMEKVRAEEQQFLQTYDLYLAPPTDCAAPEGLDTTGNPLFTTAWTFIGSPLAVIPVSQNEKGLPLAVMFATTRGNDEQLIANCLQIEPLFLRMPDPAL